MAEQIVVRHMAIADVESVCSMIGQLAAFHGDTPMLSREALEHNCLGDEPWVTILVAEIDGEVVGYTALCRLIKLQFSRRALDMEHVFVAEKYRGQGVGRAIVQAAMEEARRQGCKMVTVGTHPENKNAQDAYHAMGFEPMQPPGPRFRITL